MRIAIVNDVAMAVEAMARVLAQAPEHQLAWIARDGAEAIAQCARDTPDLILMDIVMPGTDGVKATREIMAHSPCAILLVTATIEARVAKVLRRLAQGRSMPSRRRSSARTARPGAPLRCSQK